MKKEIFSKRKIGKQLVSVAMLGLLLAPAVLQSSRVFADDQKKTETVATDSSKQLSDLIAKAKGLGVEIKQSEKKTFESKAELDAFLKDQTAKLNQAISAAEKSKAENTEANRKAQADYDTAYKKYQADKAKYDEDKKKYDAELAQMEADKDKDGHLSQAVTQSLIYKSEPSAKATVSNPENAQPITRDGLQKAFEKANPRGYYVDQLVMNLDAYNIAMNSIGSTQESLPSTGKTGLGGGKDAVTAYRIARNGSVTVDYTNLKNSSYNSEQLSKVSMTISIDPSSQNLSEYGVFAFTQDPSRGFSINFRKEDGGSKKHLLKFNVTMKFYDHKGNLVNLTDENNALLGMSSFNSHGDPFGDVEGFIAGQGTSVIDITGSSIQNQGGKYYSIKPENTVNQFGYPNIDDKDNPYFWYLGSVLKMTGTSPTFQVLAGDSSQFGRPEPSGGYIPGLWMTVNSELATKVIDKPVEPKEPEKPKVTNAASKTPSVEISEASMVITKHIDITTSKELTKEEEGTKPKRTFDGYEFVETKTVDGNTIHFYKPIDKVPIKPKEDKPKEDKPKEDKPKEDKPITRHIDIDTGKEIAEQEDGQKPKKTIDGYEFVETKDENGNTLHYYRKVKKVITKYIDIDTNEEIEPQADGKQPKKDISGYEFVETKDDNGNTLHYYRKVKKQAATKGQTPKTFAKTGESNSLILTSIGLVFAGVLGFVGFKKYRSSKETN